MFATIIRSLPMFIPPNKPTTYSYTPRIISSFHDNKKSASKRPFVSPPINMSCSKAQTCDDHLTITNERRSANYKPPIWDFDFIQSLSSDCNKALKYLKRASDLTVQVKMMLLDIENDFNQTLEFIDDLHRLNISYHFEEQIKLVLNRIYADEGCCKNYYDPTDLYSTSLRFRILRQHGFSVSQDVFNCFKNEDGNFKASLGDDTKGLLQLYEASFMLTRGEDTLELAREFATKLLQKKLINDNEGNIGINDEHVSLLVHNDEHVSLLVHNALEMPLHWRAQRPNARWFISAYERRPYNTNLILLELAKLDFNIVQETHQRELKHVSRWWEQTGLTEKLPFARDRLVECYFWTVGGFLCEPRYGYARIMGTKANALITIIDDMFDVYCTFEEVKLFNDAIQRWDREAIDKLPDYMQICFLALNNFVDEMAYHVLKEQGSIIIPHLRKTWADLCQAFFQEAKWYFEGYTPKFEEYISNARITIAAPLVLTQAYCLLTNPIETETVQSLYKYHNIVRCSGIIFRLANDLGTSLDEMNRGDVPKSIECYINETGASQEEAREYVRFVIQETWKEMNEERVQSKHPIFEKEFVRIAADLGRIAQYFYQHGDGHGIHCPQMKDRISSLLFEPIV